MAAGIGMMNQSCCRETEISPTAGEHGLLEDAGHKWGGLGRHHPPSQDPPRVHIDAERGVDEPGQRPGVGEISYPPLIRTGRHTPLAVDEIRMPGRGRIGGGGDGATLSAHRSGDSAQAHQSAHLIPANVVTSVFHRMPELAHPVEPPIGHEQLVHGVGGVRIGPVGVTDRAAGLGRVVGGRGDRQPVLTQHGADRVDPETVPVSVDVVDDHRSRRSTSAAAKNADAVLRISLALRNSATSLRSATTSAD